MTGRLRAAALGVSLLTGLGVVWVDLTAMAAPRGAPRGAVQLACREVELSHWVCDATAQPTGQSDPLSDDFRAMVLTASAPQVPTAQPTLPPWLPAGVLSWEAEILEASGRVGLDPLALAALVAIECPSGNDGCSSIAEPPAVGLAQFMPGTADAVELRSGLPCSDRTDGPTSLRCGAYHFVELLSMCGELWSPDSESAALACAGTGYNAGPGTIGAFIARVQAGADPRSAGNNSQTRSWINQFLDIWERAGKH